MTIFFKFERELALKDSNFRQVVCLTQKVLKSVYSLIINLIGFALMSNTCGGLWSNGVGQNREINDEDDQDCVEWGLVGQGKILKRR